MALHPPVLWPDASLAEATKVLAAGGCSDLPVIEDGTPIGLLTEASVIHAVAMLLGQESSPTHTKES